MLGNVGWPAPSRSDFHDQIDMLTAFHFPGHNIANGPRPRVAHVVLSKGIETHCAITKGYFANNEQGVLNEVKFFAALLGTAA